jgi:DNA replication and repair protein RecF
MTLTIYNEQLSNYGSYIFEKRKGIYCCVVLFLTNITTIAGSAESDTMDLRSHLFENEFVFLVTKILLETGLLHYTSVGIPRTIYRLSDNHPIKRNLDHKANKKIILIALKLGSNLNF